MISPIEPAEFFVVGAPVSPERPCYVERAADRQIDDALREKRVCCVLGPPGIGKSSLLERTAYVRRKAGALVARIDLAAIAERAGGSADAGLALVAERIAAELGLGVDVAAWWSARSSPVEKRLVEFFWEIVLTNTAKPIVLLFDGVEAALDPPLAAAILNASALCHARRSREPDFGRIGFVLAGRATRRQLAAADAAPFVDGLVAVVEPHDFTAAEAYRLAVAFGGTRDLAQALMDRICAWTGGHPHLTQRLARGIARTGGRLEDVERYVREQVLPLDAAERDPVLEHARALLGAPTKTARRAAALLRKLAQGHKPAPPADPAVAELLWLSGAVRTDADGRLQMRNRIVRELVAAGWLKAPSSAPKWLAAAVVLLAALGAAAYWYVETLPSADLATLANPAAELGAAETAYRRLRGLPGFEQRADELWRAALERQSRAATTLASATAADARLRELGEDATADRLLSEFWLRRARERMHLEQREAAILLAQRGAALPAADPAAGALLAELAGDDWRRLERTLRLADTPEYWHQTFARGELVSIDAARQALRTPFGAAAASSTSAAAPQKLTAVSHAALSRELVVDGEGTAGELELSLAVLHAAAGELLVTLTAPSGEAAVVTVPRSDGDSVETFLLQGAPGSPLAALADEAVRGAWRLTVVDRVVGNTGLLGGWGLRFGEIVVRDDPAEPLAIPDPVRTEDVAVLAVGDRAVAWPAASGAIGSLAVWNLATGQLLHDLTSAAAPQHVALDPTATRVLAATSRQVSVWNVADGALAARVGTETEFVLPPVFSADGGYIAIAERVDGANPLLSVLRSADGSLVSTIDGAPDVQGWELGPGGRYVALQGPETVVRVLETRRGAELRRLPHAHPVERLLHSNDGATLITVDRAGDIAAWTLAVASAELGRPVGRTAAAASVSASADGRRLAFTREDGAVAVVDVIAGVELYRLRIPRAVPVTGTQLSADGTELVTQSGRELRLWRLPPKPVTPRQAAETLPTAIAIDGASELLAVGFASGQLRVAAAGDVGQPSLAFFGHRGAVSAAALNAAAGLAATGGADGFVRVWQLASGAPTPAVAPPAELPVALVALDADGSHVASAAGRTVRVAVVADGRIAAEVQADGVVTALAFAPDGNSIAVGDATGAVVVAPLADSASERALTLGAGVTSLAFARDGATLAAGDASGTVALVAVASGEVQRTARLSTQPVRWLEWSADGAALLAATDAWLHALEPTPALAPRLTKLVVWPAAHATLAAVSSTAVELVGADIGGAIESGVVDLAAAPTSPPSADLAALVARDWAAAFALRLNDNGEPVPFDP